MLKNKIIPGNIGVFLSDTRIIPRLYCLSDSPIDMGLGVFWPLDSPLDRILGELSDFWVLIDSI